VSTVQLGRQSSKVGTVVAVGGMEETDAIAGQRSSATTASRLSAVLRSSTACTRYYCRLLYYY
jgi:hypothetical protein